MLFSVFLGDNTIAFQQLLMSFCLCYSGYICMSTNRDQKYISCHHRRRRNHFRAVEGGREVRSWTALQIKERQWHSVSIF